MRFQRACFHWVRREKAEAEKKGVAQLSSGRPVRGNVWDLTFFFLFLFCSRACVARRLDSEQRLPCAASSERQSAVLEHGTVTRFPKRLLGPVRNRSG
jgi:hypothetical protein